LIVDCSLTPLPSASHRHINCGDKFNLGSLARLGIPSYFSKLVVRIWRGNCEEQKAVAERHNESSVFNEYSCKASSFSLIKLLLCLALG
jgi:hypothetical protein